MQAKVGSHTTQADDSSSQNINNSKQGPTISQETHFSCTTLPQSCLTHYGTDNNHPETLLRNDCPKMERNWRFFCEARSAKSRRVETPHRVLACVRFAPLSGAPSPGLANSRAALEPGHVKGARYRRRCTKLSEFHSPTQKRRIRVPERLGLLRH